MYFYTYYFSYVSINIFLFGRKLKVLFLSKMKKDTCTFISLFVTKRR